MEVLGLRAPRVAGRSIALGAVVAITVLGSISASAAPTVDERELLGESYEGRPIRVFHRGDPDEIRVLVVGCIHGDECAGVRIARRLRSGRPRSFLDLWILPSLNPDGRAAHTRQNARGVDLNRNFPYRWRPGPRGRYYPGRRPASDRAARLRFFDQATERQRLRDHRFHKAGPGHGRGWTREELYVRGRSR